jgi:hypothetical protein
LVGGERFAAPPTLNAVKNLLILVKQERLDKHEDDRDEHGEK